MDLTKWTIDPAHSEVTFKVKHMMISTVTGHFNDFSLIGETEGDDFNTAKNIEFNADIDSIDTNNAQRDAHLKSADFFHAEKHPQIHFSGRKYDVKGDEGMLTGDLTIAGITKPVTLKVEVGGIIVDPYGQTKAGFSVTGKISRKDFGMTYNAALEAGGVMLSDEVKFIADVQLKKLVEEEVTVTV